MILTYTSLCLLILVCGLLSISDGIAEVEHGDWADGTFLTLFGAMCVCFFVTSVVMAIDIRIIVLPL